MRKSKKREKTKKIFKSLSKRKASRFAKVLANVSLINLLCDWSKINRFQTDLATAHR
jgi:hypothetical protein